VAFSASSVIVAARDEAAVAKKTSSETKLREKARHNIMMVAEPTTNLRHCEIANFDDIKALQMQSKLEYQREKQLIKAYQHGNSLPIGSHNHRGETPRESDVKP
jgi:hypothetical protein